MIRYIESKDIDRQRWDKCLSSSCSPLVYGYSWYLDIVSPGWCGIIEEDYSIVMPLPVKVKYGLNYIIQPRFSQQLGIFTAEKVRNEEIDKFVNAIPDFYRFIDMNLNFANDPLGLPYIVDVNKNYVLNLSETRDEITNNFSNNTIRNIRKAQKSLELKSDIPVIEFVRFVKKHAKWNMEGEYYEWMKHYIEGIIKIKAGFIFSTYFENELCATVFCISYEGRIYYLLPVSNKAGKEQRAIFAIIDHIIGKYAGSDTILDFEGSNHEGIARLYAGFGATAVNYSRIRINRLPFPYSLFIKK